MFYAAMAAPVATGTMTIGRATANVSDPFTWTEYVSNPIFVPVGKSIRLDSLVYDAGTYYLYYTDTAAGNTVNLAMSADGFTFTPYVSNPILTAAGQGGNDGTDVSQGAVIKDGATWRMYYSYRNGGSLLPGIRYATSTDGKTWVKQWPGQNVISLGNSGASDSQFIEWHQIQKIGSYYVLSYEGYNGTQWSENLAFSTVPDSSWQKSPRNPVFSASGVGGTFDQNHVATPAYFQIGGTWYLYFQGSNGGLGGFNYGSSHWAMGAATLAGSPLDAIP